MTRSGIRAYQELFAYSARRSGLERDTLNAIDIENNLIGFQGGVKYDIWNWGRRFSLARLLE